ncbi:hypothetical protein EFY79_05825 [Hanamia caeni]|uniref:Uncharacterized protein n=1 Tax=Hanamia caeni TaxID=2294116 RepID=A0A3M9NP95_9BACT|nr:hypothetical protein EFY79_05825 [Hanamia caeni]
MWRNFIPFLFVFLKVFFNFHCQKEENKKFFFQQILLIFAELLIEIFTNIFCINFYNKIPLESLFKNILK